MHTLLNNERLDCNTKYSNLQILVFHDNDDSGHFGSKTQPDL